MLRSLWHQPVGLRRRLLSTLAVAGDVSAPYAHDVRDATTQLEQLLLKATTLRSQLRSPSVGPVPLFDAGRPVRVAVVGPINSGKTMFTNVLLAKGSPEPRVVVGQAPPRAIHAVHRVQYGDEYSVAPTGHDPALPNLVDIHAPIPWLRDEHVQIIDTPGYGAWISGQATVDALIDSADAAVFITDVSRQLTDSKEVELLRRLADKRPVVVVNQIDRLQDTPDPGRELTRVIGRVNASIFASLDIRDDDGLVMGDPLTVQPVSTRLALEAVSDTTSHPTSDLWERSGLEPVVRYIHDGLLKDENIRTLLKLRTTVGELETVVASMRASLERRRHQLAKKLEDIAGARKPLEAFRTAYHKEFEQRDLQRLDTSLINLRRQVVRAFDNVSPRQIVLHPTTVAALFQAEVFNDVSLRELEYQMAHATGRLNEGARLLMERVERRVSAVAADTQLAGHPLTQDLSQQLIKLLNELPARRVFADTFVLPNMVWAGAHGLDAHELGNTLQRRMWLRMAMVGILQLSTIVATGLSSLLDLPTYMTAGAGATSLVTTYLGYTYLKMAWASGEDKLLTYISKVHRDLQKRLLKTADAEVERVAIKPTAEALDTCEALLQARLDWVKERRTEADSLMAAVRQLKHDIQRDAHGRVLGRDPKVVHTPRLPSTRS